MNAEVDALIRRLYEYPTAPDQQSQADLVDRLVAIGTPAVPELIAVLGARSPVGGSLLPRFVVPTEGVIKALGQIGDPRAVDVLILVLGEGCRTLGPRAAEALGRLGDRRALVPLVEAVRNHRHYLETHCAAARAVVRLADSADVNVLCSVLDLLKGIAERKQAGGKIRDVAEEEVLARLGELGDPAAVAPLLSGRVSESAIRALVRIGAPGAGELVQALDPAARLQADSALRVLIQLGEAALPVLREHVQGPPTAVGSRCAIALCHLRLGDERLIALVILAFKREWSLPLAIDALAWLATLSSSPALRSALPSLALHVHSPRLSGALRRACGELASRIEAATAGVKHLPVAAAPSSAWGADFPIPADVPADSLPA